MEQLTENEVETWRHPVLEAPHVRSRTVTARVGVGAHDPHAVPAQRLNRVPPIAHVTGRTALRGTATHPVRERAAPVNQARSRIRPVIPVRLVTELEGSGRKVAVLLRHRERRVHHLAERVRDRHGGRVHLRDDSRQLRAAIVAVAVEQAATDQHVR